ncbi:MAG: flavin reductase family protein [Clostridiales bacterium]|nr:flavin reductase family protein [Clostridiales bacterium]
MDFKEINLENESLNLFSMLKNDWFLLTAGNEEKFNAMTCSWGFLGVMWNKNVVMPVVRPQRYTRELINSHDYFTISFFDKKYKKELSFCGSHSGRDMDKMSQVELTPVFMNNAVFYKEAKLTILAKKLFVNQLDETSFIDKSLLDNYKEKDFHYQYIGEIIKSYK